MNLHRANDVTQVYNSVTSKKKEQETISRIKFLCIEKYFDFFLPEMATRFRPDVLGHLLEGFLPVHFSYIFLPVEEAFYPA